MMNSESLYKPLKLERLQLRLSSETQYRIKELARSRGVSMTKLIESLVDDAWVDSDFAKRYFERFM